MVAPAYVDISHFRAPYKNAYFGQDPGVPSPPAPGQTPNLDHILYKKDGKYYFLPEVREQIFTLLQDMRYEFMGGPTNVVRIVPYTGDELRARALAEESGNQELINAFVVSSAWQWATTQPNLRKVVLAPWWILAPALAPPSPTTPERYLAAPDESQEEQIRQATSVPFMAILAEPPPRPSRLSLINWRNVAIGAALLGGALFVAKRIKKRGSVREAFAFR